MKQITTRLGGEVGFDDAPGGGTIFHVELPSWDYIVSQESDLDVEFATARILLCDSDIDTAITLRDRLRQIGCAADIARSAGDALTCAAARPYAATVIDRDLQDGDGVDFVFQLRERLQNPTR